MRAVFRLGGVALLFAIIAGPSGCGTSEPTHSATGRQRASIVEVPAPSAEDFSEEMHDEGSGTVVHSAGSVARKYEGAAGFPLALKKAATPTPPPSSRHKTDPELEKRMAAAQPGEKIRVLITLKDVPEDWASFRNSHDSTKRAAFVAVRKAAITSKQGTLTTWLSTQGATVVSRFWIANALIAEVPAGKMAQLLLHPEAQNVTLVRRTRPNAYWNGRLIQDAIRTQRFHANGITGHQGSISGRARIRLAVLDEGPMPYVHPGFLRSESFRGTRVATNKECDSSGCASTTNMGTGAEHGAQVSAIAAGSIQAGQDPNYPPGIPPFGINPTSAQRERSGHLVDAYLLYYNTFNDFGGDLHALEDGILEGADVFTYSKSAEFSECDATLDPGMNDILPNVLNAGALFVGSSSKIGPLMLRDIAGAAA